MLKDLIKLANHLDQKGLRKEADHLDFIIRKLAQTEAQAEDFELISVNGINLEGKYLYSSENIINILTKILNSGNLTLKFKDGLGKEFEAEVEFDKIGSTNMDNMNNIILFTTESSDAAMAYAKQQALGIYSYMENKTMLYSDHNVNVFKDKSKEYFYDEDEVPGFMRAEARQKLYI